MRMAQQGRRIISCCLIMQQCAPALLAIAVVLVFNGVAYNARADSTTTSGRLQLTAALREQMQQQPVLTFPVFHRHVQHPLIKKRPSAPTQPVLMDPNIPQPIHVDRDSASGNTINSTIVTLNQDFGQYFAAFQLGNPPVAIAVIIDTASELLWIQCEPCEECGPQAKGYGIFQSNKSSTFSLLECSSSVSCFSDSVVETSCTKASKCLYYVAYADLSNSTGYLSKDTLTIESETSPFAYENLIFGCGVINEGVETTMNASGLMGLNRGPLSIISQLEVNTFAYCFPDRIHNTNVTGYLTLGKSSLHLTSPLQYTPMIQNMASNFTSQFYYMNMTGISVNDVLLDIPSSAFAVSANGESGGTIIDSGTTLTYFVEEAYSTFASTFAKEVNPSLRRIENCGGGYLCYAVPLSQDLDGLAPRVTLHFDNMLNLELHPQDSFRLYGQDTTYNYVYMTLLSSGSISSGGQNILGNYQQQNFLVEYDIINSRIGFASTICGKASIQD